ncbi:MAG: hypothetical protein ACI9V1_001725 [Spirosomataceae bacterium]|jgi:hypothetical protein
MSLVVISLLEKGGIEDNTDTKMRVHAAIKRLSKSNEIDSVFVT